MNAHKRFLNELRAPVKKYNRKMNDQRRRKTAMPKPNLHLPWIVTSL